MSINENIVKLPRKTNKKPAAPPKRNTRARKALNRQLVNAAGLGAVALVVTGLSLHHLAAGIAVITDCAGWEAWAMAIAIDLGFVATKFATLVANERVRKQIGRLANCTIVGTLAGSAGMNVYAFAAQTSNPYLQAAAVALGIAIPALIFAFMRIGAALWFDYQNRGA